MDKWLRRIGGVVGMGLAAPHQRRQPSDMLRRTLLLAILPLSTLAVATPAQSGYADPTISHQVLTAGFLAAHPDIHYRTKGMQAIDAGRPADALRYFMRAAFYADKPSQAMIAEMLWNGEGQAKDPALAYAWMDLAAERKYTLFVQQRERYWNAMDDAARARAAAEGQELYATYGDAAAKPRIARLLRRELASITGSRTGATGALTVIVRGPGGSTRTIDGSQLFNPKYWNPDRYQAWQDAIWAKPRIGQVDVGAVETVPDAPMPDSRIPATAPRADAPEPEVPVDGGGR